MKMVSTYYLSDRAVIQKFNKNNTRLKNLTRQETSYEKVYNNRKNVWFFVHFPHQCVCIDINLQLWLGMTPSSNARRGSEQWKLYCTGQNFFHKRAVSQINFKWRSKKGDLTRFYVNTVMQGYTAFETHFRKDWSYRYTRFINDCNETYVHLELSMKWI